MGEEEEGVKGVGEGGGGIKSIFAYVMKSRRSGSVAGANRLTGEPRRDGPRSSLTCNLFSAKDELGNGGGGGGGGGG